MRRLTILVIGLMVLGALLTSCDRLLPSSSGSEELEGTRVALAIQQTSMAVEQTRLAEAEPAAPVVEPPSLPTFTPYLTYTQAVVVEPPTPEATEVVIEQPTATEPVVEPKPTQTFEDWLMSVKILLYDDMYGSGDAKVIQNAVDGLGLGRNTTHVNDAMGDLLTNMNSATQWDLIVIGAESRVNISGEYFDALSEQMDRGTGIVLELWYIDDVAFGRIQPVMQRCGLAFHRDWWRETFSDLNAYLVYLLDPTHPLFSEPNLISMLIPYDVLWYGDVGDLLKIVPGSDGVLLGGTQQKEHSAYGVIAECMEGRMIWQTFSTHDYKTQDMINLWQNYIMHVLKARYTYLQQ
jgi:hypothetical protein